MDSASIAFLRDLNNRFYAACADSFSATRAMPWQGWRRCVALAPQSRPLRVLDVACGNMRFERFLESELGENAPLDLYAIDDCDSLVPSRERVAFQNLDIVDALEKGSLARLIDAPDCDFVGCFGFFHHVPGFDCRANLMRALIDKTALGGVVCASFWRFMDDERLAARATCDLSSFGLCGEVSLEENDYFLGWQHEPGLARYCHHFTEEETQSLVRIACEGGRAEVADEFLGDGKSGELNRYVVLRKKAS